MCKSFTNLINDTSHFHEADSQVLHLPFLFGNWKILDDLCRDVWFVAEPFYGHEDVGFEIQAYYQPVVFHDSLFGCVVRTRQITIRCSVFLHCPYILLLWVECLIECVLHKLLLLFSWCDASLSWLLDHLIERNWKGI